jgi:hypothetical protein
MEEPWSDNFALPYAPLLLVIQFGVIFVPRQALWWLRLGASGTCLALIWMMYDYVSSRPYAPEEGVPIGKGLLALWWMCSIALIVVAVAAEGGRYLARRS